jgi:hypothetical protein
MRAFFYNFIVAIFLVGALTRLLNWLLLKKMDKPYLASFGISTVVLIPLVSIFLAFDLAISTYLPSLLLWLLIDHVHYQVRKKP